jgi:MFS family permease
MASPDNSERWNFNVMLSRGTTQTVAYQLAGPRLVLPFLYLALGAPVIFAGLLLPIVQVSQLVSQLIWVPFVAEAKVRKWYLALGAITIAAALAVIGIAATHASATLLAVVFLLAAVIIGIGQGINTLAYQDLLGRVVPSHRRNTLVYTTVTLAGVLAVIIAWSHKYVPNGDDPIASHLVLVWIGFGIFVVTAVFNGLIRESSAEGNQPVPEVRSKRRTGRKSFSADLREGARKVGQVRWFRHFVVARSLDTSVTFALPFFAIHAASLHSQKIGSLAIFVIAAAVGMIIAGPLWRAVGRESIKAVLVVAPTLATLAGVIAVTIQLIPALQVPIYYGPVFLLASIAAQGTHSASQIYLVGLAPEDDRPYYIALSNTFSGAAGVVVSFGLGALAHINDTSWPIFVLVVLNAAAFLYTHLFLPTTETKASSHHFHEIDH